MSKTIDKPAEKWNPEQRVCEVCDEPLEPSEHRCGCDQCGRMFGPCCNSEDPDRCVECVE